MSPIDPHFKANIIPEVLSEDSSKRPEILFVTPSSPFSRNSGTEQRSSRIYDALTQIGVVDVVLLTEGPLQKASHSSAELARAMVSVQVESNARVLGRFRPREELTRDIEATLGRRLDTYQLIVGRYLWPICQLSIPRHIQTIVDLDDFKYRYSREAPWSVTLFKERIKKYLAHRLANRELGRFTAALLVSELDVAATGGLKTQALPNIPLAIKGRPTPPPHGKKLLFVGSLWYRPNSDGVNWFLDQVWAKVRRVEPDASLTLAGPAPEEVRRQWERYPNVTAPGFVPSLDVLYDEATVVVIPVHSGGGSNIKVLECLGNQRICVASRFTIGAFGSVLRAGQHLLCAESAQEFADQVIRVLKHPEDYEAVALEGYKLVSDQFSPEAFATVAGRFVRQVLATPRPPEE